MSSSRAVRNKGKISLSRYFQPFAEGDHVAIVKERGTIAHFSHRMQGRTGVIVSKRGSSYVVSVNDLGKAKQLIVHPINLKKVTLAA